MSVRKRIKDPLVGFGWAGSVSSAVLVALIVAVLVDVEIRYELLKLILFVFGLDAMVYFVNRLHFLAFNLFGVTVSAITALAALIAFNVAPFRVSLLWQIVVAFVCSIWFLVSIESSIFVGRNMAGQSWNFPMISVFYISEVVGTVLAGLLILYLTRSRFVAAMWGLAVVAAILRYVLILDFGKTLVDAPSLFYVFDYYEYSVLSLVFDVLTMGSLILWAVLERRKAVPELMCQSCGYDLVGIQGDACCPECGQHVSVGSVEVSSSAAPLS